jgi:hypothetical protein
MWCRLLLDAMRARVAQHELIGDVDNSCVRDGA